MTLQAAAAANLLPGTVDRARRALAESDDLVEGLFLSDPSAPAVFGRMQAAIAELLRSLPSDGAA
jgi:hypothetical protein